MSSEQTISGKDGLVYASLADIDEISSNPRRCLCDHEIRKSEDRIRRISTVLKEDFVNTFSDLPNKQNLYNLASERPLPEEATEHLPSLEKQGHGLLSDFSKRLHLIEEQLQPSLTLLRGYLGKILQCRENGQNYCKREN